MTELRLRKGVSVDDLGKEQSPLEQKSATVDKDISSGFVIWEILSLTFGGVAALSMGLFTYFYVATLHENDLWFSSIKEVEREISFRTECGLYYSYYKQFLLAPSMTQGLHDLLYDNKTESMRTINILERMNVYQEVLLAMLYKILPIQHYVEPLYFYICTLFGLQGLYVIALYVTSWLLSGTWLSGFLAVSWYIVNRIDTTRVEFTIPLRENWALPFFAVQITAITYFLKPHLTPLQERLTLLALFLATFIFNLTWQFNQFVMLMQAFVLFILDSIGLLPPVKVTWLYTIQAASLLLVCVLQFFNYMILGSLLLSFILAVFLARKIQHNLKKGSLLSKLWKLVLHFGLVICLTFLVNYFIKRMLNLESDEHIFKFLKAKFGFGSTRDFDANLYLCEEAFGLLPFNTFQRLSNTLLLCPYICVLLVLVVAAVVAAFQSLRGSTNLPAMDKNENGSILVRPETAYNLMHTIIFGCLAIGTMRMKYLWTSHACVFASFGICSVEVWGFFLKAVRLYTRQRVNLLHYCAPILIIICLYYKCLPRVMDELSELREFYDPDTVELMDWITSATPKNAAFAGSMQLLAGVKLCTGRTITNHPHYEDKGLRERTKQVYQIYAKRSPEEVHVILRSFGTDFVILEDSICYERRHIRGCRLRDLLDVDNGHIMDGPGQNEPDLKNSTSPRFCDEIKKQLPLYSTYFTQVFKNKTFHVYKLSKKKLF
ncbi:protein C-mannosyl-transferase DPY19L3 [Ambystoma mexicanum]|uniref:protein C-mannosyl-transferase DPY19L3 n=1 Tax=Ambystoma mexicanum TaxID=8296 RepID=UPI0037E9A158